MTYTVAARVNHNSDDESRPADTAAGMSLWKLSLVALPMLTVQAFWVFLMPCSAPYLLRLGLSTSVATLNNLAGPITGFFTGPLVSAMSDSLTSPYGRRRPVIVVGLALTWVAGVLFTLSEHVLPASTAPLMAAPMFWVLDVTINILQAPHRALVADLSSDAQQVPMQTVIVCMQAVGTLTGFSIMTIFDVPAEHMLELVVLVCLLNTLAVAVQFSVAEERPAAHAAQHSTDVRGRVLAPVLDVIEAAKGSSFRFRHLAAVQCLLTVGGSTWGLYAGQWFGVCVYQGDPHAPPGSAGHDAYAAGLRQFAHAGQSKAVFVLAASLVVISILRRTEVRPMTIYAALICAGAAASTAAAFFVQHNGMFALLCANLSGLPFAGASAIPFGIVAAFSKRDESQGERSSIALNMSFLNCASTFGQQLCTLTLAVIEGNIDLAQALPIMFIVAAAAEALAAAGAYLVDDTIEQKSTDTELKGKILA
ncbi:unnamed protein product [Prorocentrum cordatum]|uniref:Solute carrier family 40 protein n=1 Tax=Prorocentrum cordatum TaxID=2364126 RepID=A0ABN9YD73_9DINO|nr:unnamed protein product [Polarella glacialis]